MSNNWDGLSETDRRWIRGHTFNFIVVNEAVAYDGTRYPILVEVKGNTMASNALGSNQPDIIVQQEIFGVESGGNDSMNLAPVAPNPLGLEMPGIPMGVDTPDVMVGMAGMENIGHGPNMGTTSDSGQMDRDDMSMSAGFHMVTTDYGNNGFVTSGVPDFASAPAPITGNQNVGNSDLDNDSD